MEVYGLIMQLLPFSSYEDALAADLHAFEFLQMASDANGSQWSGVYTNNEGLYAILFDPCIAGAFTEEEAASIIEADGWEVVL